MHALPEALQAIQAGDQAATIEQFPGGQAQGALDIIVAKIRDNKDPDTHDHYLIPKLITKDNLGEAERDALQYVGQQSIRCSGAETLQKNNVRKLGNR